MHIYFLYLFILFSVYSALAADMKHSVFVFDLMKVTGLGLGWVYGHCVGLTDAALSPFRTPSHVIVLGDVNTSHRPIDHCDPDDLVRVYCCENYMSLSCSRPTLHYHLAGALMQ